MHRIQRIAAFLALFLSVVAAGCTQGNPLRLLLSSGGNAPSTAQYALKCNIDTQGFGFAVTGETGAVTTTLNSEKTSYDYDDSGQMSGVTVNVNRDLLYEESQHSYHITGTVSVKQATNEVAYDITATGPAFGDTPQTCKKP